MNDLITAGDDYELAFSVSEKNLEFIKKAGKTKKVKVSVIGKFTKEKIGKKPFTNINLVNI